MNTNRLDIRLRTVEGDAGTLQVYVTSQVTKQTLFYFFAIFLNLWKIQFCSTIFLDPAKMLQKNTNPNLCTVSTPETTHQRPDNIRRSIQRTQINWQFFCCWSTIWFKKFFWFIFLYRVVNYNNNVLHNRCTHGWVWYWRMYLRDHT